MKDSIATPAQQVAAVTPRDVYASAFSLEHYSKATIEGSRQSMLIVGMPAHWLDAVVKPGKGWGKKTFEANFEGRSMAVTVKHIPRSDFMRIEITCDSAQLGLPTWVRRLVEERENAHLLREGIKGAWQQVCRTWGWDTPYATFIGRATGYDDKFKAVER